MKKFLPNRKNGFTLVELMVVVSILAILAVIGIVIFSGVQKGARDAGRRGDIDAISKSLEVHYNSFKDQFCTCPSCNSGTFCTPQGTWFSSGSVPVDPGTNSSYGGLPVDGAESFNICATLENSTPSTYCRSNQQ